MEVTQYEHIFDSHAHYTDAAFEDDRDFVLEALPGAGVCGVMLAASDLTSSRENLRLAERYPYLHAAIGVHPECEGETPADYLTQLETLVSQNPVCAIGEIGLDYHYEGFDKAAQIRLFSEQLAFAKAQDLPVIVHSRDATEDCMQLLREFRPAGVLHCFGGSAETAREVLGLGMYLGFTGVLTFKNAKKALSALEVIPMDRLLLETDCPYMAPEPYRRSRSDSRMIPRMAERVALQKGLTAQQVLTQTCENAKRLFRL